MRWALIVALLVPAIAGSACEDLVGVMNRFRDEYNVFAESCNRGVFDARRARKLSELWRKVERCGCWPREE
jgi:hypothetical protein